MVIEHQKQLSFEIVDTERVIESMRASGYKSTTHALAELIDNSIEANASTIELFGVAGGILTQAATHSRNSPFLITEKAWMRLP